MGAITVEHILALAKSDKEIAEQMISLIENNKFDSLVKEAEATWEHTSHEASHMVRVTCVVADLVNRFHLHIHNARIIADTAYDNRVNQIKKGNTNERKR